ncbi:pH-response regulator protein palA/rim20, partial [Ceratobasidium sp. 428]
RSKWEEWEENVEVLGSEPDQMERLIPSHTTSANSAESIQAHTYARAIRTGLEHLEDLQSARARCVESARQRANTDDIKPRIMREAAGLARWVEVKAAMFEGTVEEEMGKFDRYRDSVEEGKEKQAEELARVEHLTSLLVQARTDDPILKQREAALQSLDLAYHRYLEVLSNVTEGAKASLPREILTSARNSLTCCFGQFYAEFSGHLNIFLEECIRWVDRRREQRSEITELFGQLSRSRSPSKKTKSKGKSRARTEDDIQLPVAEPEPEPKPKPAAKVQARVQPTAVPRAQPQQESPAPVKTSPSPPPREPTPPARVAPAPPPSTFKLPAPGSSEWEEFELPSPPVPPSAPTPRKPARAKAMETTTPGRRTRSKAAAE